MAIEVNKVKEKVSISSNILIALALILIIIFFAIYTYIFLISLEVKKGIEEKEAEISTIVNERKKIEEKVIKDNQTINDFKAVLNNHKNIVRIFGVVENLSHPYTWFPSLSFQTASTNITLLGIAKDFTSLGQQIIILKRIPGIKNLNLSGISPTDKGVSFSLSFTIDSAILK